MGSAVRTLVLPGGGSPTGRGSALRVAFGWIRGAPRAAFGARGSDSWVTILTEQTTKGELAGLMMLMAKNRKYNG